MSTNGSEVPRGGANPQCQSAGNTQLSGAPIQVGQTPIAARVPSYARRFRDECVVSRMSLDATNITLTSSHVKASHEDVVKQSAQIVAEWLTYLPQECVNAMMERGWHRTTR